MGKYILKKLIFMIPMLIIISMLVFFGLQMMPVDPINYMVSPDMNIEPSQLESLREHLGLNDNIFIRYGRWALNLLKGDFGYSIVTGTPIITIIKTTLPATFELALVGLVISTVLGIIIGIIAAVNQNNMIDNIIRFLSVLSTAIPRFFFGILILNFFAIKLKWLPIGGRIPSSDITFWGRLKYLVLPGCTIALTLISALVRYTRNSMLDVFNMDYVKTARAKGVAEWKVYVKHVFRNALRPIVVLLIFRLPMLIGGSVIIENIFSWPGIGKVILSSVSAGDYPVIMITTLMVSVVILFVSLLVDIVAALLDPRVRY